MTAVSIAPSPPIRQRLSCDDCLEVKREDCIRTSLCHVVYHSGAQQYARKCEQFLDLCELCLDAFSCVCVCVCFVLSVRRSRLRRGSI